MIARRAEPIMKGARRPSFSEMMAVARVVTKAKAYGGIVSSWATAAS